MHLVTRSNRTIGARLSAGFASVKSMAVASMLALSVFAGQAMAQAGPDTSAIEAEFSSYKTAVIALVIAFAVVLWAIKASGLLKPR